MPGFCCLSNVRFCANAFKYFKFTVPIGIGFVTTVNIGKVPFRFGAEAHYSIITSDDTLFTKWNFRFYVIPAAPSALFGFMN